MPEIYGPDMQDPEDRICIIIQVVLGIAILVLLYFLFSTFPDVNRGLSQLH
jgi:hypothetical protein